MCDTIRSPSVFMNVAVWECCAVNNMPCKKEKMSEVLKTVDTIAVYQANSYSYVCIGHKD
jgi:hypothetical protein